MRQKNAGTATAIQNLNALRIRIPEEYRTIDMHNHVRSLPQGGLDEVDLTARLAACECLGIAEMCVSEPLTTDSPTPDEVRAANDTVLAAMRFDARVRGFCFVNPGYARESLAEIDRCVGEGGMLGVKMYHQYFICDPAQRPVMQHCAKLGVPVLMHAGRCCDEATKQRQPRLSDAGHFIKAASMFPDTILIQGHIGGGGDWEWNLRMLEERPNIYIDSSGSVIDSGIVRRTVDALGLERVLFATDGIFEEGVGKVFAAGFSADEERKIFRENFSCLLKLRRK